MPWIVPLLLVLLVAIRCFSSGVVTTDLSFFVQVNDHWKLALWYPVRHEALQVEQQKDGLSITGYDEKQKKSVSRLFIPYDTLFSIRG
jgi:hypothetical protein